MSIERDLIYRFSTAGAADVIRSFGTVSEAIRRLQRDEEIGAARGGSARRRQLTETERLGLRVARDQIRASEKAARESARAAESGEKQKVRAAQAGAKEQSRVAAQAAKEAVKHKLDEVRKFAQAERDKTAIAKREAKVREQDQAAVWKAQQNSAARQLQVAAKLYRDQERAGLQRARDEAFNRKRLYRGIGGAVVDGAYGGFRALGTAGGAILRQGRRVGHALGANDAVDVGGIFAERMAVQQRIRLVNQESGGRIDEGAAYGAMRRASALTGFTKSQMVEGLNVASMKGKGAEGLRDIGQMAKEARAYGASVEDISFIRSQALVSAEASGQEMTATDLNLMIAKIAALGKRGTMRISDFAKRAPEIFSRWATSGQKINGGQLDELVGWTEMVQATTGQSAKTKTAMASVQNTLTKPHTVAAIHALGIKTLHDDTGMQRDPLEVVMDVIAKTGGGESVAYGKIFGDARSTMALAPLVQAQMGIKDPAKRLAAMRAALFKASNTAGITAASTDVDFEGSMGTDASKFAASKEKIRNALETSLVPVFERLASKLPAAVARIEGAASMVGPVLNKLGDSIAHTWATLSPVLTPVAKRAINFAASNPVTATFLAGAIPSLAKGLAGAGARYLGESMVNTVPGVGGMAAKTILGVGGRAIQQAGSTPVYITGAAPGIFGGGGGGLPGGIPGAGGAGGAAGAAPLTATTAAVVVGALAQAGAINTGRKLSNGEDWDAWDIAGAVAATIMLANPVGLAVSVGAGYVGNEVYKAYTATDKNLTDEEKAQIVARQKADQENVDLVRDEVFVKPGYRGFDDDNTPQEKWEQGERGAFTGLFNTLDAMTGNGDVGALANDPAFKKFFANLDEAGKRAEILSNVFLRAQIFNESKIKPEAK